MEKHTAVKIIMGGVHGMTDIEKIVVMSFFILIIYFVHDGFIKKYNFHNYLYS